MSGSSVSRVGESWPLFRVYDRWTSRFTVGGKTLVPYDVGLSLESVDQVVAALFAVIRERSGMSSLRLVVQQPPRADLSRATAAARAAVAERLAIDSSIDWVEELPLRWKGMSVIAAKEWGAFRV